jgi:16S rRNA (cytosine967-C5)-methyltransferase
VSVLVRVERGAFAHLALAGALERSALPVRDRQLATELVYGVLRMRRAVDFLVSPYVELGRTEDGVRAALRVGAYESAFRRVPAYAAVSSAVAAAPPRARSLVNAVLRRVAAAPPPAWPDLATELSYPDWIVERLVDDLGSEAAREALDAMNRPARSSARPDGYIQDLASQWVADLVEADGGHDARLVADVCAGPGGKATALARASSVHVVAADVREARARRVRTNARRLGLDRLWCVVADGRRPCMRREAFDRVLVDAPCSGLGALRRRPDARWRVRPDSVARLAALQRELVGEAAGLLRPGGVLVYSVCTMTEEETAGVDRFLAAGRADLSALPAPPAPWRPLGRGALLLPSAAGTDGMYLLRLERTELGRA